MVTRRELNEGAEPRHNTRTPGGAQGRPQDGGETPRQEKDALVFLSTKLLETLFVNYNPTLLVQTANRSLQCSRSRSRGDALIKTGIASIGSSGCLPPKLSRLNYLRASQSARGRALLSRRPSDEVGRGHTIQRCARSRRNAAFNRPHYSRVSELRAKYIPPLRRRYSRLASAEATPDTFRLCFPPRSVLCTFPRNRRRWCALIPNWRINTLENSPEGPRRMSSFRVALRN